VVNAQVDVIRVKNTTRQDRRERGSGCLIPPRSGVTRYWTGQVYDINGKLVRRSLRASDGTKISGEYKGTAKDDPKDPKNWTNVTAARLALDKLRGGANQGNIAVGNDPSQLYYGDLRTILFNDYRENKRATLRVSPETGEEYITEVSHLDEFFGWTKQGDVGVKVSTIGVAARDRFVAARQAGGAENGTINRSLSALIRMFRLAQEAGKLQTAPPIKKLPEPKQPKQGFLEFTTYNKLHKELPEYVQPVFQMGFYTGMRLGEILNLTWDRVDLKENVIRLQSQDVKNRAGRTVPLIDGLPTVLKAIRRKNPKAGLVFLGLHGEPISSFRKAWAKACVKVGIKTKINGEEIISHFEGSRYVGFTFHDLRRTGVRNLVRAGVPRSVAMAISGHKTEAVFERYNIVSETDIHNAAAAVSKYLRRQKRSTRR
jgi:integrase